MSTRVREVRKEAARASYAPRLKQQYESELREKNFMKIVSLAPEVL